MNVPCQACDGKGSWRRNRWLNWCPCCRHTGCVAADVPVIRISLAFTGRTWIATATAPDGAVLRTARYGWAFGALAGVGYHDDRPHVTYRNRYPGGYRLDLESALAMARAASESSGAVSMGLPAGSGVAR